METLNEVKFFTLRELLNLTDELFHVNGEIGFEECQYLEVGFDDLNVKNFDLSNAVDKLDLSTPIFRSSSSGSSSFQVAPQLDLVYELDFSLHECGFEEPGFSTGIPYTRDQLSIYIHNTKIMNLLDNQN